MHQSNGLKPFWHQGPVLWKTVFPPGQGEWFGNDSSALQSLCTLFLLLLYQLDLRLSGSRFQSLGTPVTRASIKLQSKKDCMRGKERKKEEFWFKLSKEMKRKHVVGGEYWLTFSFTNMSLKQNYILKILLCRNLK